MITQEQQGTCPNNEIGDIDYGAMSAQVQATTGDANSKVYFQVFDERKERLDENGNPIKDKSLTFSLYGTAAECYHALNEANKHGAGIFIVVNKTDGCGRKAENILGVNSLFIDLDGAPLPSLFPISPSLLVETSPGRFHVYWPVKAGEFDKEDFKSYQQHLAKLYEGDRAVCDLPRVMRVAGSWHNKTSTPFQARIIHCDFNARYSQEQIDQAFGVPERNGSSKSATNTVSVGKREGLADLKETLALLAVIPSDDYPVWFKVAGALKTELGDELGYAVWKEWSKNCPQKFNTLSEEDLQRQWREITGQNSYTGEFVTIATLYDLAKEHGGNEELSQITYDNVNDVEISTLHEELVPFSADNLLELDSSLLPESLQVITDSIAESLEVPSTMVVMSMLGLLSAIAGAKCVVKPTPDWKEPCLLYIMLMMPPGHNKTQTLNVVFKEAYRWEKQKAAEDSVRIRREKSKRESLKAIVAAKRKLLTSPKTDAGTRSQLIREIQEMDLELDTPLPEPFMLATNDITMESLAVALAEQKGVLSVISDEAGVIETLTGLYTKGSANTDLLLKGFDGGDVRIKRQHREHQLNPYLTLLLLFQPKVLKRVAAKRSIQDNGFFERVLYALPKSMVGRRELKNPPIPDDVRRSFELQINQILALPYPYDEEPQND